MNSQNFTIKSLEEMAQFAAKTAASVELPTIIALKGSLGVGKSTFAKEFINSLQDSKTKVLSPTFNLVYSYQTKKGEIFHFDLYRIKSAKELENIGFFDAIKSGICLIEWPEIAANLLPKNYIEIEITNGEGEIRLVKITKN